MLTIIDITQLIMLPALLAESRLNISTGIIISSRLEYSIEVNHIYLLMNICMPSMR